MIERLAYFLLDRFATRTVFPEKLVPKPVFAHWHLWTLEDGRRVGLHHFYASADVWGHDHARGMITIGLKGGYSEQPGRPTDGNPWVQWKAPWIRWIDHTFIHRFLVEPGQTCWSLMISERETIQWFFYTPDGQIIPWQERETADTMEGVDPEQV